MTTPVLEVSHLRQYFRVHSRFTVKAVDDISFSVQPGEIFALVGESGSGKSTVAKTVMGLYAPTDGEIAFQGHDITHAAGRRAHSGLLHRKMQIIFQDSAAALNPRMTVGQIILEPLKVNRIFREKKELVRRLDELLELVGLNRTLCQKTPPEISGGQRQRVAIARSIALQPDLLIADEPIAALDVSIQAQIVNLFQHLQAEHGFAFLFIAHDLAIVRFLSDRVGVLYHGKLVECAPTEELFRNPLHPYTRSLLSAVPKPDPIAERNKVLLEFDRSTFPGKGEWKEVSPGHFLLD